jgi:hypothetical protein
MSDTPLKSFHEELVQFTNEFLEKRTGIGFADMVKILEFVHATKSIESTIEVVTPVQDFAPKTVVSTPKRVAVIRNRKSSITSRDFENYFSRALRNGTMDVHSFYNEFERQYGHKFNDYDFSIDKNQVIPVWKCKLYNFVYLKRQKKVLYPASFDRSQLILKSHYKI